MSDLGSNLWEKTSNLGSRSKFGQVHRLGVTHFSYAKVAPPAQPFGRRMRLDVAQPKAKEVGRGMTKFGKQLDQEANPSPRNRSSQKTAHAAAAGHRLAAPIAGLHYSRVRVK